MSANYFTLISVLLVWLLVIFGFWKFQRKNLAKVSLIALGLLVFQGTVGYFEWLLPTGTFPTFLFIPLFIVASLVVFSKSQLCREMIEDIPFWFLIGFQSFRVLPETMLHLSYTEGLAPIQMTWHGLNFDIVSAIVGGLGAIVVLIKPQWTRVIAWLTSIVGISLLLTIVTIAILSAPLPFRVFMNEPANIFVTQFPYIYLPGIHVLLAGVFHLLLIKKLLNRGDH